jgi:protein-S-isoprenylcysteine O-methyltransferase Ste14
MDMESVLKVILISQFCVFSIIRIVYQRVVRESGLKTLTGEGKLNSLFLGLFIAYEIITFFSYLFYPQLLSWATIPIPMWLRWIGACLGILSLVLFVWVHRSLGRNFSTKLRIKERHSLVTHGRFPVDLKLVHWGDMVVWSNCNNYPSGQKRREHDGR